MSDRIQMEMLVASGLLLVVVLELVRRRKLTEEYLVPVDSGGAGAARGVDAAGHAPRDGPVDRRVGSARRPAGRAGRDGVHRVAVPVGDRVATAAADRAADRGDRDSLRRAARSSRGPRDEVRILHVIHDFLPRHQAGSEIYALRLCRELAARHHVSILCAEYDRASPPRPCHVAGVRGSAGRRDRQQLDVRLVRRHVSARPHRRSNRPRAAGHPARRGARPQPAEPLVRSAGTGREHGAPVVATLARLHARVPIRRPARSSIRAARLPHDRHSAVRALLSRVAVLHADFVRSAGGCRRRLGLARPGGKGVVGHGPQASRHWPAVCRAPPRACRTWR